MRTTRDRLFQAGRHLTPTQFGKVVARVMSKGIDWGGYAKGQIIDHVQNGFGIYNRCSIDALVGELREQKNHHGTNAFGNPPPGLIKESVSKIQPDHVQIPLKLTLVVSDRLREWARSENKTTQDVIRECIDYTLEELRSAQ